MPLNDAQTHALDQLVEAGEISAAQRDAVTKALGLPPRRAESARLLIEIGGYLGGGLLLAGVTLMVGSNWEDMGRASRIAVTMTITAVLVATGQAFVRWPGTAQARRVAAVLMGFAAVSAAIATAVIAETHEPLWSTSIGLVVSALGYLQLRGSILLAVTAGFSVAYLASFISEFQRVPPACLAGSFVALGFAWLTLVVGGAVREHWVGLGLGTAIMIGGAQSTVGDYHGMTWSYIYSAVAAAAFFGLYFLMRNPILLGGAVIASTLAISEAIWDWSGGAVGGGAIVAIAGAIFLLGSGIGFRTYTVSS